MLGTPGFSPEDSATASGWTVTSKTAFEVAGIAVCISVAAPRERVCGGHILSSFSEHVASPPFLVAGCSCMCICRITAGRFCGLCGCLPLRSVFLGFLALPLEQTQAAEAKKLDAKRDAYGP